MIYDTNLISALGSLGISADQIEKHFPKTYYIVITWNADNSGTPSVEKLISISGLTLIQKQGYSKQIGTYSKVLKYPYSPFDLGFYKYCQILVKQENHEKLKEVFYNWMLEDIAEQEYKNQNANVQLDIELTGSKESLSKMINSFVGIRMARESAENIMLVLQDVSKKNGLALFGEIITKATKCTWIPAFGVVPSLRNSHFRYLFSGLKAANLNKNEYEDAVFLLKRGYDFNYVRQKTGWTLDMPDGKPRKFISSQTAQIKEDCIQILGNSVDYIITPEIKNINPNDCTSFFYKSSKFFEFPTLSEVLDFDELYEAYPQIAEIRVCLVLKDSESRNGSFTRFPFNAIYVNTDDGQVSTLVSILLHEVQHAIQKIEGFAEGGNISFAKIVASSGVEMYKELKITSESFESFFSNLLETLSGKFQQRIQEGETETLNDFLHRVFEGTYASILRGLQNTSYDLAENFMFNKSFVTLFILNYLIKNPEQDSKNQLKSYILSLINECNKDFEEIAIPEYFDRFFDLTLQLSINFQDYSNKLMSQGYAKSSLNDIAFCYYIAFGGEIESRFVQGLYEMNISKDLARAVAPLSLETQIENKYVYDGSIDATPRKFAYESNSEKEGCLHLSNTDTGYELFHEIGHAVLDYFIKLDNLNEIVFRSVYVSENEDLTSKYDFQEYFAESFCAYIKRKKIEEKTTKFWPVNESLGLGLENAFDRIFNHLQGEENTIEEINRYLDAFILKIENK